MDKVTSVAQQTENSYHRQFLLEQNNHRGVDAEVDQRLHRKVYHLLLTVVVHLRHRKMTQHIIETSIESVEHFNADEASKAFIKLEQFARNLISQPWKAGFRKIKIYSGFLKLHIEKYLRGTKALFEALGYRREKDELILKEDVGQREREMVAQDCYIAHVEMQILKEIFLKVSMSGYTYMDVYRSRQHCIDDLLACENWIFKHCKPKPRVPVETDYSDSVSFTGKPSPPGRVSYPPQFSLQREEVAMDIYSPSSKKNQQQSIVSVDGGPSDNPAVDRFNHPIEGSDSIVYATGTVDDHMKETMKILAEGKDSRSPGVAPPSYDASGLYPSQRGSDDEWVEVRKKIKNMGSQFADPGGRGDILGASKNFQKSTEVKHQSSVKSPTSGSRIPSIHPRPSIGRVCAPKQRTKSFGQTDILVTDGPLESPTRSPTGTVQVPSTSNNLIANIQSTSAYPAVRDRQPEFSTFRNTDMDSQNPQYVTKLAVPTAKPKQLVTGQNSSEADGDESDVYVSLRETNTGTADLRHGKPSFQENFQKTSARFYQHDMAMHSLPFLDGRKKAKIGESSILKTTPSKFMNVWECDKCTYANKVEVDQCEICATSRRKGAEQIVLTSGGAQCQKCTLVNKPGSGNCSACGGTLKGSPTYI